MPRINPTLPADGDDAIVAPYNAAITAILGVLNGAVDADNLAAGAVTLANLSSSLQQALVPTATIVAFGGSAAPSGWLMCDGSSYLRSGYSSLFAALGTNYGSADGTHFNVPDLRGRVPVGSDAMGGTAANISQRSTTLTTTSGNTSATVGSASGLAIGMKIVSANVAAGTTITAISGTTITLSANATGTGAAVAARFSVLADAQVLGSIGGEQGHQLTVPELAAHTHTTTSLGTPVNVSGGSFTAAITASGTFTTNSTGNDLPHNNIQPSQVTSYIIKI